MGLHGSVSESCKISYDKGFDFLKLFDSAIYSFFNKLADFLLLNLIWLVMCLPILTIFPATTAMYGVIRHWLRNDDDGVFRLFFIFFRENFKQSFLIGLLWILFMLSIFVNYNIIEHMPGSGKEIMTFLFVVICVIFGMASIYIFPVMVHYKMKWFHVIAFTIFLSMRQLGTTIISGILILLAIFISVGFSFSIIIIWSPTAYLIYLICSKALNKFDLHDSNAKFQLEKQS